MLYRLAICTPSAKQPPLASLFGPQPRQSTAMPHLLLQVLDVSPVVLLHLNRVLDNGVRVGLGVARNADAKVIAVLLRLCIQQMHITTILLQLVLHEQQ